VKAELLGGVGSRVEYDVVNPGVRDGEEEVVAEALLGPRTNRKGTRFPVNDSPGQEERFLFVRRVLVLSAKSQVSVTPSGIREGVSHGSG
jgi:hypothetical protein